MSGFAPANFHCFSFYRPFPLILLCCFFLKIQQPSDLSDPLLNESDPYPHICHFFHFQSSNQPPHRSPRFLHSSAGLAPQPPLCEAPVPEDRSGAAASPRMILPPTSSSRSAPRTLPVSHGINSTSFRSFQAQTFPSGSFHPDMQAPVFHRFLPL